MNVGLLKKIDGYVGHAEELFLGVSHGIIAVLIVTAVFFRYALSSPLTWNEELVVTLFTWMIFIGLANGFRHRSHIVIEILVIILPAPLKKLAALVSVMATCVTLCTLVWFGMVEASQMAEITTPMLGISTSWSIAALPAGMALSLLHVLSSLLQGGFDKSLWPTPEQLTESGES